MAARDLIVDTDAGVDDALALMLALAHPDAEVVAVTAVGGNVPLENVVPNVFEVLHAMGAEGVPVFPGVREPLLPGERVHATEFHGEDGLGDLAERRARVRPQMEHAAAALVRLARERPGELTLVALGPLTNLALALRLEPGLPRLLRRLVVMGGAHAARGNTPHWAAEFNFYFDPEAAQMVVQAFPETTLVTWETTLAHPLLWTEHEALAARGTPRARFYAAITRTTRRFLEEKGLPGLLIPDPLAMAAALEPGLVTSVEHHRGWVETCGTHSRGQLVLDHGRSGLEANVRVVTGLDREGVRALFQRTLGA
ncbi:nucleoside hydrolase [Deinococcota bacterium DY0809b]